MMKEIGDGNFECTLDTNFEPGAARKKATIGPLAGIEPTVLRFQSVTKH